MKILFFNSLFQDYLSDSILIGLKALKQHTIVEYPGNNYIYKTGIFENASAKLYGNGFTLYNLIDPDEQIKTTQHPFDNRDFDLFIFSNIFDQFGLFIQYLPVLNYNNTLILDGVDTPALYPYNGYFWRRPPYWFLPRAHQKFRYYKREWTQDTTYYRWYTLPPRWLCAHLPAPVNLRPISFSIPSEKIITELPLKKKRFPRHIVDEELTRYIAGSAPKYAFENEEAYYLDLQNSRYGITTKRAGWDCLRHYEIAANGAVICFKDLDKKPITCAPHGLVPGKNCLNYRNYDDLIRQIDNMTDTEYQQMQQESLIWVHNNTCQTRAFDLLDELNNRR